jgi:hypothetical protein
MITKILRFRWPAQLITPCFQQLWFSQGTTTPRCPSVRQCTQSTVTDSTYMSTLGGRLSSDRAHCELGWKPERADLAVIVADACEFGCRLRAPARITGHRFRRDRRWVEWRAGRRRAAAASSATPRSNSGGSPPSSAARSKPESE